MLKSSANYETFNKNSLNASILSRSNRLLSAIAQKFPIHFDTKQFDFYPFCNEMGYKNVMRKLKRIQTQNTQQIKVALLFGESNFISMLPALIGVADLILLADIEPSQHKHLKFMLNCLKQSDSPAQFIDSYAQSNNPLYQGQWQDKSSDFQLINMSKDNLKRVFNNANYPAQSLLNYHFLHSVKNFLKCKRAMQELFILQIEFDLGDTSACNKLAELFRQYNACLTLCNFTNIHHYVENITLFDSIPKLLNHNNDCLIMYSTGPAADLKTNLYIGIGHYFSYIFNQEKNPPVRQHITSLDTEHSSKFIFKDKKIKDKKIPFTKFSLYQLTGYEISDDNYRDYFFSHLNHHMFEHLYTTFLTEKKHANYVPEIMMAYNLYKLDTENNLEIETKDNAGIKSSSKNKTGYFSSFFRFFASTNRPEHQYPLIKQTHKICQN
ncbi:hypothetical protein Lsan_2212 [Legionella santicrucis]|uniref:Uncharacterized protein n=1 Tax=Legionella santicrucis TaxID=45074 RepID=A0A0W0YQY1_9GAMM|nr:hypothetical protein [Legionella santicrucis]KTD59308.1 hypothetical protein Lsan_2212 [Legionella santicrucis]